jgi:Peptidase A4 family
MFSSFKKWVAGWRKQLRSSPKAPARRTILQLEQLEDRLVLSNWFQITGAPATARPGSCPIQVEEMCLPPGAKVPQEVTNANMTVQLTYSNIDSSGSPTWSLGKLTLTNGWGKATVTLPAMSGNIIAQAGSIRGESDTITVTCLTDTVANWAGYVINPGYRQVNAVGGSWVQPTISGPNESETAIWVGIDGWASNTVEQIGTNVTVVNGVPKYYAWWAMYPEDPNTVAIDTTSSGAPFNVNPGDRIQAEVLYLSSSGPVTSTFLLSITDTPVDGGPVETFSTTQTSTADPLRSSAEWVVETPLQTAGPPPECWQLANFDKVTFTGAWATAGSITGCINAFPTCEAIDLDASWGQANINTNPPALSNTPAPGEPAVTSGDPATSSFTVQWISSGQASYGTIMYGTPSGPMMGASVALGDPADVAGSEQSTNGSGLSMAQQASLDTAGTHISIPSQAQAPPNPQPRGETTQVDAGSIPMNGLASADAVFAALGSPEQHQWLSQDTAQLAMARNDALFAQDELALRLGHLLS